MTDATPAEQKPRTRKAEVVEDAVIVDDTADAPVEVEVDTAAPSETEPVVATEDPAAVSTAPPQQVVYVQLPPPPRKLGNRGVGVALAAAAAVLFTALLAGLTILFGVLLSGSTSVAFLGDIKFYIPTLFFLIGFVLLVVIVNRANWGAYIVGSLLVGLFVYFGSIGLGLLANDVISNTPAEAASAFAAALRSPFIIAAALVAREVTMWVGIAISRRGRRLKVRNAEAREAYERELAEKKGDYDRSAPAAAPAD